MNKSQLFRNFNAARKLAKEKRLDIRRVNAGLAIAQRKGDIPYDATPSTCKCPDANNRNVTCKHQIAAALREA